MIFSIKPQIFELKCVFSYFRLKTHITLLLPVYVHSWEQRKVSETAEIVAGGTPSTSVSEYWEPKEVPWLSSGEVHKKYVTYTDDMISKLGLSNSSAKMIKENSILIALAGQGKTRGTVAINRISLSTNQSIAAMTFNDDIIPEFVFSNLENRYDEIRAMSSGDGSRGGLNKQLVGNIVIPYTIIEEQRKIGAYFENLDNLITLHQRKCQIDGCRFQSPLAITWEQRKLGEVFEQTTNLVSPNEDEIELWSLTVEDGLTPKSERYNREFLVKKDNNFKEVRPGDIVYNPMNMTLGAVGYNGMAKSVAVSGYYTTMITKKGYDAYYINTWLKSPQAILLYKTYATGSLIEKQRVQFPTLSIIPAAFPNYDEQTKIGQYFESLDNLITLHQCE